jgi:Tol biopolymer transport system component
MHIATCLLVAVIFSSCGNGTTPQKNQEANTIHYPKPFPDSTALTFLPDLVSKDSFDFNAAFSPDGQSFYFSRSVNKQTGIYVTRYNSAKWQEPSLVSTPGTNYSDADPAFGPDGKLYFISNRPANPQDTTPDYDIWFRTPMANGGWSDAENMKSINSDSNEYYVSFSENGNLYFASSRKGGFGGEDVYVSRFINGQYTTPDNLGAAVNSSKSEFDPGISKKEDLLIFASSNREGSFGAADLYYIKRDGNGKWQQATNLGNNINTKSRDFCPAFSPDSKYFFFSSERNVKWISMRYLFQQIDKVK